MNATAPAPEWPACAASMSSLGTARAGDDLPGFVQQVPGVAGGRDPRVAKPRFHRGVARHGVGRVEPRPVHRCCAGLPGQLRQNLAGVSAPQDKPAAHGPQPCIECGDRQTEAPARRGADRLCLGVEDEDRNYWAASGQRRGQGRMIGEAQVAAEPDEVGA
jgi:hypothetical protein